MRSRTKEDLLSERKGHRNNKIKARRVTCGQRKKLCEYAKKNGMLNFASHFQTRQFLSHYAVK